MPRRPHSYDDLRAVTDTERAALTAAAVLPDLPDDESLLVVITDGPAISPARNDHNDFKNYTERDRFIDYADPINDLNLYRVTTDEPGAISRAINKIGRAYDVNVTPQPHPTHAPYYLSHGDFVLLKEPQGDYDYSNPQWSFDEMNDFDFFRPDYDRHPTLPI